MRTLEGFVVVCVVGCSHWYFWNDDDCRCITASCILARNGLFLPFGFFLLSELTAVVEYDEDTNDLEDPDNAENDSNDNSDDLEALLTDPCIDVGVVSGRSGVIHASIKRVVVISVEHGPNKVDSNTHIGEGIDCDGPCIGLDKAVEMEDRTDKTDERDQSQQSERDRDEPQPDFLATFELHLASAKFIDFPPTNSTESHTKCKT